MKKTDESACISRGNTKATACHGMLRFDGWSKLGGGVLDISEVTAGSRQSLAISTLAKIRSRSWRLADLAISGYQPLTLARLLALGGGLFPPRVTV